MLLFFAPSAAAFCGTFVGPSGAALVNRASQVVVAREGDHTTLTLAADYEGDLADFALLVPLPTAVTEDDVHVVDPDLIARVDEYSSPRMVEYTCDDVLSAERDTTPLIGCGGASKDASVYSSADAALSYGGVTVDVEAYFVEGEYTVAVLSAEESEGLMGWLDQNGYAVPEGGEDILQEYIDAGAHFLAARVTLPQAGATWLSPLQIAYDSEVWSLPIRIGTINAEDAQEVLVYALTAGGQVGISNYPQLEPDDECMLRDADLVGGYQAELDGEWAEGPGWVLEHAWSLTTSCDPCTATTGLTPDELHALGLTTYHAFLTRLRVHYAKAQAAEDLVLYDSGIYENQQTRFIRYDDRLESLFPVCGEGFVEDPGTCEAGERAPVVGCSAPGTSASGAAGLLAFAMLRRRRA